MIYLDLNDKFWRRVLITADDNECWQWQGNIKSDGYGSCQVDGKTIGAHRIAYEKAYNAIPDGHEIHHKCETPSCVNPNHLVALTRRQHRAAHTSDICRKGHPKEGKSHCLICRKANEENRYQLVPGDLTMSLLEELANQSTLANLKCPVAILLRDLDPSLSKEFQDALDSNYTAVLVAQVLRDHHNVNVNPRALQNHRRQSCSCRS